MKVILDSLAQQAALVANLEGQGSTAVPIIAKFPIKSQEDLEKLDGEINLQNKEQYIQAIKTLLKSDVKKSLRNVLADDVVMAFNVDGVHGKKALKSVVNFYDALLVSIDGGSSAEMDLRKAMQLSKKRVFKVKNKTNE
ncbi:uncharacterized protein LOC115625492 isoform X4 [Scaptodrosophila lebanonensis]|uniref:Uncharacterized protein LOC115625492 isoform X4 n=1 Tax=Drosophila lebanonensis TaxID=7225 RepID=A0A6J2TK68_DROLE|nr:uncharacterized protein LOC115625492 isoform X4 [Scaptodrosophila lebanonensis]